mmetsp:Transcript_25266/g.49716  ORF Transcript_25266/g.49716 Transcript_25266/m.49716 type:complete len:97 (+) Transcript_25266:975-1265(+)
MCAQKFEWKTKEVHNRSKGFKLFQKESSSTSSTLTCNTLLCISCESREDNIVLTKFSVLSPCPEISCSAKKVSLIAPSNWVKLLARCSGLSKTWSQ